MSKQLILVSSLILLISACAQQATTSPSASEEVQHTLSVPSNTVEAESTSPTITVLPDLAATEKALPRPTFPATITAIATATAACPGAPGPYAAIGNQVIVVAENTDKLKLRSAPTLSPDTVLHDLERFTQLTVVSGPVCVRDADASYWFWQVEVHPDKEVGWVAEGDVTHSFIMVSVGQQYFPKNTPTATTVSACPPIHAPYGPGVQAIVITENSDKLKLRSEPVISPSTVIRELDQYTRLEIVGGPMCAQSVETGIGYWLWKVKVIPGGKTGWVAEGDGYDDFIQATNVPP